MARLNGRFFFAAGCLGMLLLLVGCASYPRKDISQIRMRPATFVEDAAGFRDRVRIPELPRGDMVILRFAGYVSPLGRLGYTYSYMFPEEKERLEPFELAARRALEASVLSPAVVDGRAVWVWGSSSVVFSHPESGPQAEIVPYFVNSPTELEKGYVVAQRYQHQRSPRMCLRSSGWVTVDVDAAGGATDVRLAGGDYYELCAEALRDMLVEVSYIPAHKEGTPVAGRGLEPF